MAARAGMQRLAAELRSPPPPGLSCLSDAELGELAGAVREARHREAAELREAAERSLSHIPRLLRGPVRRVFGAGRFP